MPVGKLPKFILQFPTPELQLHIVGIVSTPKGTGSLESPSQYVTLWKFLPLCT